MPPIRRLNDKLVINDVVARNFDFLYAYITCKSPKQKARMIQRATRDELKAIIDICYNIKHKHFELSEERKQILNESERLREYLDLLSRVRSESGTRKI